MDKQGLRKDVISAPFLRKFIEEMFHSNENGIRKNKKGGAMIFV